APLLRVGDEAAREENLALARAQAEDECDRAGRRLRLELRPARAHGLEHARDLPLLALLGARVVALVGEGERHDAVRDQVRPVDACEAPRDDAADAEVERREGRLLAARALAVVVAADDDPSAPLLRPRRE